MQVSHGRCNVCCRRQDRWHVGAAGKQRGVARAEAPAVDGQLQETNVCLGELRVNAASRVLFFYPGLGLLPVVPQDDEHSRSIMHVALV